MLKIHNLTKSGYMDEETANYIEVKQGGRHLLDSNQFEYRDTKKKPNKTDYQCIQRKNNSWEWQEYQFPAGEHTHDSDLLKKRVREIEKQVVKESSGNKATSPRTLLGNIYNIGLQRYRD